MTFLLAIALLLGVTVIPVMVGARVVNAQNTGFGSAFFAIILLVALSSAIQHFVSSQVVAFAVSVLGGAAILAGTLGTSFLKGLAVSFVVAGVQLLVILSFFGAALGISAAT
jgi:hypothetical protein